MATIVHCLILLFIGFKSFVAEIMQRFCEDFIHILILNSSILIAMFYQHPGCGHSLIWLSTNKNSHKSTNSILKFDHFLK